MPCDMDDRLALQADTFGAVMFSHERNVSAGKVRSALMPERVTLLVERSDTVNVRH